VKQPRREHCEVLGASYRGETVQTRGQGARWVGGHGDLFAVPARYVDASVAGAPARLFTHAGGSVGEQPNEVVVVEGVFGDAGECHEAGLDSSCGQGRA
jgi:hypothetical protein